MTKLRAATCAIFDYRSGGNDGGGGDVVALAATRADAGRHD